MGRPNRFAVVPIVAAVLAMALLVSAEIIYRQRLTPGTPRSVQLRFYRHARLERAMARDTSYGDFVHINRLGFRGPDIRVSKSRNTTRVIAVGASTTFDTCARRDAETWPARLEYWLEALAPGRDFEVINAGVPGASMLDHVIRLETEYYALEPDVFLIYAGHGIVGPADAAVASSDDTPDEAIDAAPWDGVMRRHSRLYDRVFPRRSPSLPQLTAQEWAGAIENARAGFERHLTSFTVIAQSMDAEVVMVEINRQTGDTPPERLDAEQRSTWKVFSTPDRYAYESHVRYGDVWRNVAQRTHSLFIPNDSIRLTGPAYYCDNDVIHFNNIGSDEMGHRLAGMLLSSEVLASGHAESRSAPTP